MVGYRLWWGIHESASNSEVTVLEIHEDFLRFELSFVFPASKNIPATGVNITRVHRLGICHQYHIGWEKKNRILRSKVQVNKKRVNIRVRNGVRLS